MLREPARLLEAWLPNPSTQCRTDRLRPCSTTSASRSATSTVSKAFYEKALEPLGIRLLMEFERRPPASARRPSTGRSPSSGSASAAGRRSAAPTSPSASADRAAVDAFHAAALAAGGTDNGAPGPRPIYHPGYYGAFVLDPDGNNVEAVCHTAAGSGRYFGKTRLPTVGSPSVSKAISLPSAL